MLMQLMSDINTRLTYSLNFRQKGILSHHNVFNHSTWIFAQPQYCTYVTHINADIQCIKIAVRNINTLTGDNLQEELYSFPPRKYCVGLLDLNVSLRHIENKKTGSGKANILCTKYFISEHVQILAVKCRPKM